MPELCPECGVEMVRTIGDYRYIKSGLRNITLLNWEVYSCGQCKTRIPSPPDPDDLILVLVKSLLAKPSLLFGDEVYFLRKSTGKDVQVFAELANMDTMDFSHMEKSFALTSSLVDEKIRRFVFSEFQLKLNPTETREIMAVIDDSSGRVSQLGYSIEIWRAMANSLQSLAHYPSQPFKR